MSKNIGNTMIPANLTQKTFAIALILILGLSSALTLLPTIKAASTTYGQPYPYSYTPTKGANGLWNIPTFPGVTVSPDPVGVGQPVAVIMIIELLPPSSGQEASTGTYGGWIGFTLTITNPNGTSTTLGPYESDVSGTYQVTYTPTTVGTYNFVFNFPGQTVNGTGYGDYFANFLPSTTSTSLTVQQAQLTPFQEAPVPLPTQYWTQPINGQNRAWNVISGPWLYSGGFFGGGYNATGGFNPYTYAPQSAHIIWTKTATILQNGLVGGQYGSLPFCGTAGVTGLPENNFQNAIVMGGYVYYSSAPEVGNTAIAGENPAIVDQAVNTESCANLQTGQVIWTVPLGQISGAATPATITDGQILDWRSQQQRMDLGYLWSIPGAGFGASTSPYALYDASTGAELAQWNSLPAGTTVAAETAGFFGFSPAPVVTKSAVTPLGGTPVEEEPHTTVIGQDIGGGSGGGAMLVYITGQNVVGFGKAGPIMGPTWLACWNSTLAINSLTNDPTVWNFQSVSDFPSIQQQQTTPLDWEWGIMWNITLPNPSNFMVSEEGFSFPASWGILGADGQYVILDTGATNPSVAGTETFEMAGVSVANLPMTTTYVTDIGGDTQHTTAGSLAWVENITEPAFDQTFLGYSLQSGGNIIGVDTNTLSVTDYSTSTGALLWSSNPFNNDFSLQSVSPGTAAYGMLYSAGYDGYMHAINITTGVQMWDSISRPGALEMPEPGYPFQGDVVAGATINTGEVFASTNKAYETQPAYRGHSLYAYNALTGAQNWNISGEFAINAIADGILIGQNSYDGKEYAFGMGQTATTASATLWNGQNIDISGTVTDQSPGAPGTPAISDTWMTPWMQYLYMDQPYPTQATGVNVVITAIDPNHNLVTIGNATSDLSGYYSYAWSPPSVPGKYTIIATFNADNSYYGSCAETSAIVTSPASPTAAPTATPTSVADMYFVPAIAGIIIVIIIGFIILALLMLRKRP